MSKYEIAPSRSCEDKRWEGICGKKPWEYKITAAIPVLDTPECIKIVVDILRLQTERPYIMIIDTGSTDENLKQIQELHDEDVEVHSIRLNGVLHPSDFPAMAMDLAQTLCRTEYLFATHADCFLRRKSLLEDMLRNKEAVVGYELSPRDHDDWEGMVSHTASLYHVPTLDKIGFGWSLRRLCNIYGARDQKPNPLTPNWPDTEILGNYILRENKIEPVLIGKEDNFCRNVDDNIDHFRSLTSGKLYDKVYYEKALKWMKEAREEALERIERWTAVERIESSLNELV